MKGHTRWRLGCCLKGRLSFSSEPGEPAWRWAAPSLVSKCKTLFLCRPASCWAASPTRAAQEEVWPPALWSRPGAASRFLLCSTLVNVLAVISELFSKQRELEGLTPPGRFCRRLTWPGLFSPVPVVFSSPASPWVRRPALRSVWVGMFVTDLTAFSQSHDRNPNI